MLGPIVILGITGTERSLWKTCTGGCSGQSTTGRRDASIKFSHLFVVNAALLVKIITQMVHVRLKGSEGDVALDTGRLLFFGGESVERPLEET
jgi:hypothetical protein